MFVLPISRTATRPVAPPFGRVVERLFDESVDRYFGGTARGTRTPALDVSESDTTYTVTFDMPGVTREQLKLTVEGRRVSLETVEAATEDVPEPTLAADTARPAAARVLYRERAAARYARTVSLPAAVDPGTAQARLENGVLTLTLPKQVATGATRVAIG